MKPAPALPDVHRAIGQLQRLTELFGKRRVQLATGAGLSEQQWRVLEEIATEHFMPSMFARGRRSTAAAVSRIIRQLLDKQLVSVSVSRTDGRQRRYVLTAKGKRTLTALRTQRRRAIDAVWMDLDPEALDAFNRSAGELIGRLEAYATRPRT
jgi:DNA-binding MarR family transcriptional regulator